MGAHTSQLTANSKVLKVAQRNAKVLRKESVYIYMHEHIYVGNYTSLGMRHSVILLLLLLMDPLT